LAITGRIPEARLLLFEKQKQNKTNNNNNNPK